MASGSVWIRTRSTKAGAVRHSVEYRLGGREAPTLFGGSFGTKREASIRKVWILGEIAAGRAPNLNLLAIEQPTAPTLAAAAGRWRASRVDVSESTRTLHRVALARALPTLGPRPVDEITVDDVVGLVTVLDANGSKRETIRKTIKYLAAVLDENGVKPNPARDRRIRLPHEEQIELVPPTAEHVEAVYRLLPSVHRLPLVWLDWSGARVASIDLTLVSDYDEQRQRVRLRRSATKTRAALWVDLPDALAAALNRTLPPREDRGPDARLFPGSGSGALRTSIAKACRAAAVPLFSPHDLRHRRISLLHRQGRSWAEIARFVGQRKLSLTADTYTHVLSDGRDLDLDHAAREAVKAQNEHVL